MGYPTAKDPWPFGVADQLTPTAADMAAGIRIDNRLTTVTTPTLAAAVTLVVLPDANLQPGAIVLLKSKTAAAEIITLGGGIDGPPIAGVAGKTKVSAFMYVGGVFIQIAATVQID